MLELLESDDQNTLSQAKAQWLFGEWSALAAIDVQALRDKPERDRYALLAASAQQQLGDHDNARRYTRLALRWGCPPRLVGQILIAGVHNTLGRAAALGHNDARAARHFRDAVALVSSPREAELLSHARSVREMARLGLLPQAVGFVENLLHTSKQARLRPEHTAAHAKVLDMEVDWIRERVLALQKDKDLASKKDLSQSSAAKANADAEGVAPTTLLTTTKYYGLHGLDKKLEAYIPYDGGYFVELGANDGVAQSNTLYFERERNWRGVLIEPVLHRFLECKRNRSPENKFYCVACVSFGYDKTYVNLAYADLMTSPFELESEIQDPAGHAESGKIYMREGEDTVEVMAPARTLNEVLADAQAPSVIDLLSLDVEGAEIEVLKGIDHARTRFKYLLIESRNIEKLSAYLGEAGYCLVDKLSHHDYLFSGDTFAGGAD